MKRILVLAITLFLPLCVAHTAAAQDINAQDINARDINARDINDGPAARRALLDAIENGDRRAVLKILSTPRHVDLNQREPGDGETFLIKAIHLEERAIVRILLEKGADPNLRAISAANSGDNPNAQGVTPLDAALETDDVPVVRLLIQHGVNVQQHQSVLHSTTSEQMLRLLLENGAPTDGRNEDGATYLQVAIENDDEEIVQLLIERGANVNVTDEDGATPLMLVESPDLMRLLIERGANVNAADKEGQTALHRAVLEPGMFELAELLIAQGANVNVRDNEGYTPLDHVIEEAFDYDLALLLVSRGARINEELVKEYGLVEEFEKIRKGESPPKRATDS
jgi:ankyrin repeat protein